MYVSNGDYYGRINIGDKPIREAPQTTVSRTAGLVLAGVKQASVLTISTWGEVNLRAAG
jgi:hypothetical protein